MGDFPEVAARPEAAPYLFASLPLRYFLRFS